MDFGPLFLRDAPDVRKAGGNMSRRDEYEMHLDGEGVFMQLASASSNYTKPELVMDTFLRWARDSNW